MSPKISKFTNALCLILILAPILSIKIKTNYKLSTKGINFGESCKDLEITNTGQISGSCKDLDNNDVSVTFDLASYLAFAEGNFVWSQDGKFQNSCLSYNFEGTTLHGICLNNGTPAFTDIDLGLYIENENGKLQLIPSTTDESGSGEIGIPEVIGSESNVNKEDECF